MEESFSREEEARIQAGINAATNETEKQILINQAIEKGLNEQTKLRQKAEDEEERIQKGEGKAEQSSVVPHFLLLPV